MPRRCSAPTAPGRSSNSPMPSWWPTALTNCRGCCAARPAANGRWRAPLPAGAPFVLLDEHVVTIASGLDALERSLQLRVVAAGRDHGDPTALALDATPQATALKPLAPVHLKAARGASGVTFTWIRRTRVDGDSWVGEVPLGEDSEPYALDILSGSDGGAHADSDDAISALYAAADEIADFGAPQSSLHVRVAQLSATVGRGFAAEATLILLRTHDQHTSSRPAGDRSRAGAKTRHPQRSAHAARRADAARGRKPHASSAARLAGRGRLLHSSSGSDRRLERLGAGRSPSSAVADGFASCRCPVSKPGSRPSA